MSWHWPRLRARPALVLLALFVGVGLAQGVMIRLLHLMRGGDPTHPVIVFQLTGSLGAWLGLPLVYTVVLNAQRFTRPDPATIETSRSGARASVRWWPFLGLHLGGYLCFSAFHLASMRAMRWLLFSLGFVSTSDGVLEQRILWELQNDMVVYGSAAAMLTMLQAWRERDDAAYRTVALEARLAETHLAALTAQVDPHFFYNALNTVSAVMYEDLPKTERLLASLAAIMRSTLRDNRATWTLAEERAHTERYVELLLARFEHRLAVDWRQQADTGTPLVPRFAVQTLVENAVKHNSSRLQPLRVEIDIAKAADTIRIAVEDDGKGFSRDDTGTGKGLARLEQTLKLLHGDGARLVRGVGAHGGARVEFSVPHRAP